MDRTNGIETRSIANSTIQQHHDSPLPPMSVLTQEPQLMPSVPTQTAGSVFSNMMNSQYSHPNRSVNALTTVRINSGAKASSEKMALIDSGADTFLVGGDFYIEDESKEIVHVVGFQDHMKSRDMKIGTAITAVVTADGATILLRANNVILGVTGNTLLSSGQIEDYDHTIDSRPRTKGGKQRLYLQDGHVIPLVHSGPHMYLKCRYPTEA
ncbi:MAG: hypothetical protein ACREOZ_00430, partial [Gloeomargaritales cyanobacterium]